MAVRSNMVLMDLFAVCGGERGDGEMVCHCKSLNYILSPLCHRSLWLGLTHMRPTLFNDIMIRTLYGSGIPVMMVHCHKIFQDCIFIF